MHALHAGREEACVAQRVEHGFARSRDGDFAGEFHCRSEPERGRWVLVPRMTRPLPAFNRAPADPQVHAVVSGLAPAIAAMDDVTISVAILARGCMVFALPYTNRLRREPVRFHRR